MRAIIIVVALAGLSLPKKIERSEEDICHMDAYSGSAADL